MEEFNNEEIKLNSNKLRYKGKIYKLFCIRKTEWQARKVRDDLRSNGYKTVITENKDNKTFNVWWIQ